MCNVRNFLSVCLGVMVLYLKFKVLFIIIQVLLVINVIFDFNYWFIIVRVMFLNFIICDDEVILNDGLDNIYVNIE